MLSLGRAYNIILLVIERLQRGRQRQEREDQDDRGGRGRVRKGGMGYLRGREKKNDEMDRKGFKKGGIKERK